MSTRENRFADWWLVLWLGGAVTAIVAMVVAFYGTDAEGLRVALRATARTSLVLFLTAFLASSSGSKWLLANRRYFGVSFAVSHVWHLVFIVWFVGGGHREPDPVTLVLGGLAYVFLAAMTATSFDRTAAWLGAKSWHRLHKVGAYYIWFIFFATYAPEVAADPLAALSTLALVTALAVRIASGRRATQRSTYDLAEEPE